MKTKFSGRNVALMVAPAALAMGIVLMAPLVADHLEKNHDRLDHIRAGRKELYNARLQPCPDGTDDPRVVAIVAKPGEVDVAIFPSFSTPEGFNLSRTTLSGYSGAKGVSYPPPPPPPPGFVGDAADPPAETVSQLKWRPPVTLDEEIADQVLRILKVEIDEADSERTMGLDGIGYVLRHDDKCAITWSPEPDTRAHKIVELIHALNDLSTKKSDETGALKADVVRLTTELDADRRELKD